MKKNHKMLMEDVRHGTQKEPLVVLQFETDSEYGRIMKGPFFCDQHWHYHIEMIYIRSGHYEFQVDLESYKVGPGDFCLVSQEALHMLRSQGDFNHSVVIFDPMMLDFSYDDMMQEILIGPLIKKYFALSPVIRADHPCHAKLLDLYERICVYYQNQHGVQYFLNKKSESDDKTYPSEARFEILQKDKAPSDYIHIKLLLYEFLLVLWEHDLLLQKKETQTHSEAEKIHRFKDVITYMKAHYAEVIALEELADIAKCNSSYLCRFFKEIAGETPIQYLIRIRIENSCHMLENTSDSILEIAMSCGFDNVSYYIRQFKKEKGMTPGQYRKTQALR